MKRTVCCILNGLDDKFGEQTEFREMLVPALVDPGGVQNLSSEETNEGGQYVLLLFKCPTIDLQFHVCSSNSYQQILELALAR